MRKCIYVYVYMYRCVYIRIDMCIYASIYVSVYICRFIEYTHAFDRNISNIDIPQTVGIHNYTFFPNTNGIYICICV